MFGVYHGKVLSDYHGKVFSDYHGKVFMSSSEFSAWEQQCRPDALKNELREHYTTVTMGNFLPPCWMIWGNTTIHSLGEISYLHPEVEDEVEEQVQHLQSPVKEKLIVQTDMNDDEQPIASALMVFSPGFITKEEQGWCALSKAHTIKVTRPLSRIFGNLWWQRENQKKNW